jgi:hypothetical protein
MSASGTPSSEQNVETGGGAAPAVQHEPETTALSADEFLAQLEAVKPRVMPILEAVQREYRNRVRRGYPQIVDNITRGGIFGLNLEPGYGVYFMTDGTSLYAELHTIAHRSDTLSAANNEKFAGRPRIERREIDDSWADHHFRNLISELLNRWNFQQLRIYRVDS